MKYKAASFFSGIGGLDLAFVWAGFDVILHCEIEEYPRRILNKNRCFWPNARVVKDIRNVTKSHVGNVDVMFGGFPCQDISIAGKRAGITKRTRSGLWFEFLRLISEVRPRVVVLENVSAIHVPTRDTSGNEQPSPMLIVAATLAELGYDAIWLPIRASDIGAPHSRERWFCVAYRNGEYESSERTGNRRNESTGKISDRSHGTRTLGDSTRQRQQKGRKPHAKQAERASFASKAVGVNLVDSDSFRQGYSQGRYNPLSKLRSASSPNRRKGKLKPRLGRATYGLSYRMDRHKKQWPAKPGKKQFEYEPRRVTARRDNRIPRLKALGNAVVPQQAYPIALAVKRFLDITREYL